jgi:glucose/arabinose dehydrogenase
MVTLMRDYDERGLLGLAFDPGFATNGRFFVYYGAPLGRPADGVEDHLNRLSELHVSASDPDRADPASEQVILEFSQPQPNHSGGGLGFGPDGYLYLGTGDGGGSGDASEGHSPQGNAQDRDKLNGKILRLDVSVSGEGGGAGGGSGPSRDDPYRIPDDNPFANGGGRPEIYALGFRNPWRLGWEPDGARRLVVSDVGYGRWEELDVVSNGGNYGWRVREGAHCLDIDAPLTDLQTCDLTDDRGVALTDPVLEYGHGAVGVAIVAGYVYRGSAIPALAGRYVFADWSRDWTNTPVGRGSLLVAEPAAGDGEAWPWRRLAVEGREGSIGRFVTGLGEDAAGELYVLTRTQIGPGGTSGEILKLVPPG